MDENRGMLLLRDKQARILLALVDESREWYLTELAKTADVTYIHTSRFVGRCESSGIMESEKHGKTKRVFLTEKGKRIAQGIRGIMAMIEEPLGNPASKNP